MPEVPPGTTIGSPGESVIPIHTTRRRLSTYTNRRIFVDNSLRTTILEV